MPIQDTFKSFMKSEFGPMLRALGFKGTGQNYALPVPGYYVQIGVQKSRYSDQSRISFTLNIQVISEQDWESARQSHPFYPAKPNPNTFYGAGSNERIGLLLPENRDLWWNFDSRTDTTDLISTISNLFDGYVLPHIRSLTVEQHDA